MLQLCFVIVFFGGFCVNRGTFVKTALLIDQDRDVRVSLALWLRQAGWEVWEAEEGEAGVAMALDKKPELVFCDLLTPRLNGYQVCRSLRAQNALLETKIILTTSSGYSADRRNAMEAGATEYMVKPILRTDLMQLLNQHNGTVPEEDTIMREMKRLDAETPAGPVQSLDDMIPPGQMSVRFWGVRGSIPTPGPTTALYGGNTSCVEVRADGEIIILDAGTGIRPLGLNLTQEAKGRPLNLTVLISHTHWDHIQGFPFFDAAYNPKNNLKILGFEGARDGLLATLSSQMESPYFPIGWQQLPSHIALEELKELKFKIGSIEVEAAYLNHPGLCMGYRLNTSCGSVAYLPDNEPFQRYKYHSEEPHQSGSTEFLTYARKMDQKLVDFVEGADVVIMDSQYDATEYQTRVGWGHGCVDDVVALALNANAKRLFLFHHDPSHDDEKITKMTQWGKDFVAALGETIEVEAAREGLEVVLKGQGK